ncbi:actin maturation protease isoform X3 [Oncorhynchus clarkii lewisi]|uniref:actin maturation protease isoform X3 n=1 Tax=Oncorhynchus clarkii lewisi TaxID=490388 RepID=UPI0039B8254D
MASDGEALASLITQNCTAVTEGSSMGHPPPPPPPGPPPPAAASGPSKKKLYQAIAAGKTPVEGDHAEARLLLSQRESRCGLVALWMAGHLLQPPLSVSMEAVVQTAMDRGYTAQGEMFSASDMAMLAEEVCGCRAELLSGGMSGDNSTAVLKHLADGQPVLIPYDEDFNHEPCQRTGHRAHWAVASGVLLGLDQDSVSREHTQPDPTLPWLLLPQDSPSRPCPCLTVGAREAYILAKQGKSLRYQLWGLDKVAQSNAQLREIDPQRAGDSTQYVVPKGGVEVGLAGQVVLVHTGRQTK